ncbi:MAG TPA: hypothetical protein EYP73_01840 [Acidimicrobiia bacterium]|nr:hypothetical protein [Acidimicrobiia bacterium]
MVVFLIKFAVFVLSATAVLIGVVPILVLVDLLGGGTGYGLCPNGLQNCDRPYTTGAEMVLVLLLALFGVILAIRLLMRLARRLQNDSFRGLQ